VALVYFDSSALVKLVLDEAGSDITASCSSSPSVRYQPSNSSVYSTYSELAELGPDGVEALAAETGGVEPLSLDPPFRSVVWWP
jgi:hypothetical protein